MWVPSYLSVGCRPTFPVVKSIFQFQLLPAFKWDPTCCKRWQFIFSLEGSSIISRGGFFVVLAGVVREGGGGAWPGLLSLLSSPVCQTDILGSSLSPSRHGGWQWPQSTRHHTQFHLLSLSTDNISVSWLHYTTNTRCLLRPRLEHRKCRHRPI